MRFTYVRVPFQSVWMKSREVDAGGVSDISKDIQILFLNVKTATDMNSSIPQPLFIVLHK